LIYKRNITYGETLGRSGKAESRKGIIIEVDIFSTYMTRPGQKGSVSDVKRMNELKKNNRESLLNVQQVFTNADFI
jgi:hypothetical protein